MGQGESPGDAMDRAGVGQGNLEIGDPGSDGLFDDAFVLEGVAAAAAVADVVVALEVEGAGGLVVEDAVALKDEVMIAADVNGPLVVEGAAEEDGAVAVGRGGR